MMMIGWPKACLKELMPYESATLGEFAGAAFSGFALLPVVQSALYAAGKCGLTRNPEQELSSPNRALLTEFLPKVEGKDKSSSEVDSNDGSPSSSDNGSSSSSDSI